MELRGRCYCGAVHYEVKGEPLFKGQCLSFERTPN